MKLITFLWKSSSIKLLTRLLSWDWWNHPWISLVIITGRIRAFSRAVWARNKTWGVVTVFSWNFLTKFPEGMGKVQSWVRGELIQFHRVEFKIIHSSLVSATCCDLGSQWWSFTAHVPSSLDQLAAVAIASACLLSSRGTWMNSISSKHIANLWISQSSSFKA